MEPPQQLSSLYQKISKTVSRYVFKAKMREHSFVLIIAVIIGVLAGFGSVGIQELIIIFKRFFWQGEYSLEFVNNFISFTDSRLCFVFDNIFSPGNSNTKAKQDGIYSAPR